MGILEGTELEQWKDNFLKEVAEDADRIYEKYKWVEPERDITEADLQTAILLEMRNQRIERLNFLKEQQAKERIADMNSQERFLDASEKIYTKTPKAKESDTFISCETDRLCKALYSFGDE